MPFYTYYETTGQIPLGYGPRTLFNPTATVVLAESASTRAVLVSSTGRIVLTGAGLTYKDGAIAGGTISRIEHSWGSARLSLIDFMVEPISAAAFYAAVRTSYEACRALVFGQRVDTWGSPIGEVMDFGDGKDYLAGVGGNDTLFGGGGNDILDGGEGRDRLYGGDGDDDLEGGAGNDFLYGGEGYDGALYTLPNTTVGVLRHIQDAAGATVVQSVANGKAHDLFRIVKATGGWKIVDLRKGSPLGTDFLDASLEHLEVLTSHAKKQVSLGLAVRVDDNGDGAFYIGGTLGRDTIDVERWLPHWTAQTRATVKGGNGNDRLTGLEVRDALSGEAGADVLVGRGGNDHLSGGDGNDTLVGGDGNDYLVGGRGRDVFVFNSVPSPMNLDTIADFRVVDDTIRLDDAVFTRIGRPGALGEKAFWMGSRAHDATDRILYDKATGALFYDPDGTGAAAKVQFAQLAKGLALTAADFVVI